MPTLKFIVHRLMAIWLVVCALIGYAFPEPFAPFRHDMLWMLATVIFLMGLTLKWEEIGEVFRSPRALVVGVVAKWIFVPITAYIAAVVFFSDQPQLAAGVILDGATPSGVSANVFTFLSGGAVALSIAMSAINTLISPILTPAITAGLADTFVKVDAAAMFTQMVQVVLVPVLLGLTVRTFFRAQVERMHDVFPIISSLALYTIVIVLIASSANSIRDQLDVLPKIAFVTSLQIIVTLALGFLVGLPLRVGRKERIAIMFEVGIYNSGLGAAVAAANFGAFAALPAIANAMFNLIIGALLTAYLSHRMAQEAHADQKRISAAALEAK